MSHLPPSCFANTAQVKIPAGHEFYITTDEKYATASTAEYMYLDYVSLASVGWSFTNYSEKHCQRYLPRQAHLR